MTARLASGARVVIADDHPPTRAGVRQSLCDGGFDVCGEAADAAGLVNLVEELCPDAAVVDIHMPGGGINAIEAITAAWPDVAVVALTVSRNDDDLFDAVRAGAQGYLLKDMDPDRLALALQGVLEGEAALPRGLMSRVLAEFRARERRRASVPGRPVVRLTSREWEVLDLMREGLTTRQMAVRLGVSAVTVRSHVSAVLHKLDVPDRAAAMRLLNAG